MRKALFCTTPYHILLSIVLVTNKKENEEFDIYIVPMFNNAEDVIERVRRTDLFGQVHVIRQTIDTLFHSLKKALQGVFPPKDVKALYKEKYQKIYFFSNDFMNMALVVKKYKKKNINCEFVYAEDGIGSYYEEMYIPSLKPAMINFVLGRTKYLKQINKLAVLCPALVDNIFDYELETLPNMDSNQEKIEKIIKTIWDTNRFASFNQDIMYFKTVVSESSLSKKYIEIENNIANCLKEMNWEEHAICKFHPRDFEKKTALKYSMECSDPFECMLPYLNTEIMIFISGFSTCMYTPFLLYNKKTKVILTSCLLVDNYKSDDFFFKMKELFGEEYIMIPKNMDEFQEMLKLHIKERTQALE